MTSVECSSNTHCDHVATLTGPRSVSGDLFRLGLRRTIHPVVYRNNKVARLILKDVSSVSRLKPRFRFRFDPDEGLGTEGWYVPTSEPRRSTNGRPSSKNRKTTSPSKPVVSVTVRLPPNSVTKRQPDKESIIYT